MIYFRVDGNKHIATGHVMRCLAIALELKEKGENCTFIVADNYSENIIQSNGFPSICIESKWNNLECETDKLIKLVKKLKIEKLIIDSYFVRESYLTELKKLVKIIYIDDLNLFQYPVDILINYSINYPKFNYKARYKQEATKLLLGSKYVPLRKEFSHLQEDKLGLNKNPKKQVKKILITTGGSDPYNFTGKFLDKIVAHEPYKDIIFHVVVGRYNEHMEKLEDIKNRYPNIILHTNVTKMSKLMINCDIAISAGGTTLYELCACGTPSICFAFVDNQLEGAEAFGKSDIIPFVGDIRGNIEIVISRILDKINKLIQSDSLRLNYSIKMRELIDGNGAVRIAEEIIKL